MTFICAIRASNGILLAADSLEVESGAFARWDDFHQLLESKALKEDCEDHKISPKEITGIFKPERIKNRKGAQKIFPLSTNAVLLVAGHSGINGKKIEQICDSISDKLKNENAELPEKVNEIVFQLLEQELNADSLPQLEKETCQYILCVRQNSKNNIFRIKYCDNINDRSKRHFSSIGDDSVLDIIYMAGFPGMAIGGRELNKEPKYTPAPIPAFRMMKCLMELSILSEEHVQEIPGVGGEIVYLFLHDKGWTFVASEGDLLRLYSS